MTPHLKWLDQLGLVLVIVFYLDVKKKENGEI